MLLCIIFISSKFTYPLKNINNVQLYAVENKSHSPPTTTCHKGKYYEHFVECFSNVLLLFLLSVLPLLPPIILSGIRLYLGNFYNWSCFFFNERDIKGISLDTHIV